MPERIVLIEILMDTEEDLYDPKVREDIERVIYGFKPSNGTKIDSDCFLTVDVTGARNIKKGEYR